MVGATLLTCSVAVVVPVARPVSSSTSDTVKTMSSPLVAVGLSSVIVIGISNVPLPTEKLTVPTALPPGQVTLTVCVS